MVSLVCRTNFTCTS